jgi:hypothetical protein
MTTAAHPVAMPITAPVLIRTPDVPLDPTMIFVATMGEFDELGVTCALGIGKGTTPLPALLPSPFMLFVDGIAVADTNCGCADGDVSCERVRDAIGMGELLGDADEPLDGDAVADFDLEAVIDFEREMLDDFEMEDERLFVAAMPLDGLGDAVRDAVTAEIADLVGVAERVRLTVDTLVGDTVAERVAVVTVPLDGDTVTERVRDAVVALLALCVRVTDTLIVLDFDAPAAGDGDTVRLRLATFEADGVALATTANLRGDEISSSSPSSEEA